MSDYTREIWVRTFIVCVWLALAIGAVAVIDPERDTAAAGAVIVALVAGLAILRPFPGSHLVLAAVAAVLYAAVQGLRAVAEDADPDATYVPAAAVGAFAIVITAIVADLLRDALTGYDEALSERARLIEELEVIDPVTGATKANHATRLLNTEVERARRYGRPFTVLMLAPDHWAEYAGRASVDEARGRVAEAAQRLLRSVRVVDTLIALDEARFVVLLPETGVEGAQVVGERLVAAAEEVLGMDVRTGIASFPDDEVTSSGLMREAEEALAFAQAATIRVASRSLLT